MLQKAAPLMHAAMPALGHRQLLTELRDRLVVGVDYVREVDTRTALADASRDDPDVAVPDVLAVEGKVLITRWVDGTRLPGSGAGCPATTGRQELGARP